MLALNEHKQAYFIGIRSTFYRLAMITGQGLLIILTGFIESSTGLEPVNFSVSTQQEQTVWQLPPTETSTDTSTKSKHFVVTGSDIALGLNKLSSKQADSLKNWTKTSNIQNGFLKQEKIIDKSRSWWSSNVSTPLKEKLKKYFGNDEYK
jgi:PAT family beta-lactamase induction signal transducer AmpG